MERELKALQEHMRRKERETQCPETSYWAKPWHPEPDNAPKAYGMMKDLKRIRERSRERKVTEEFQEDVLRSFPVVLPKLAEPGEKYSALMAGDWITQVRPLMADVSGRAGWWWDQVVSVTTQRYMAWLEAPPLEKLHILPPSDAELPAGYERLVQRVTNMLLAAVPESVKGELIATRQLSPQGIYFKILKAYQPGGLSERASTLQALTSTVEAEGPRQAVEELRLWKRQLLRTQELGASLPDPTLLIQALDNMMRRVLRLDSQAAFRVNAYRMQQQVDVKPSQEGVCQFHKILLAEAELLAGGQSRTVDEVAKPEIKVLQGPHTPQKSGAAGGGASVCKWWGSEGGCRSAKACRYFHPPLDDRHERCWNCSSKSHRKAECPYRGPPEQPSSSAGGSAEDGGKGTKSYTKSGFNGKGKGKKGGSKDAGKHGSKEAYQGGKDGKGAPATMMSSPAAEEKREGRTEGPAVQKAEVQAQEHPTGDSAASAALMSEVTTFLRSFRVGGGDGMPQLRACQMRRLELDHTEGSTLLDGGATHCLRERRSEQEWKKAVEVRVQVASGEVVLRQDPESLTILSPTPVQQIVPMGKLVQQGYCVRWDKSQFYVEHSSYGRIPVTMVQGCPVVSAQWGNQMMQEIEEAEKKRAKIRQVLQCGVLAESAGEKKTAELAAMFPNVPLRILEQVPGEENWDPLQVPFNRRMRRTLEKADKIVVDMFSGAKRGRWRALEQQGYTVLEVDLIHGCNVLDPHVSGYIESLIGRVVAWMSGPPCRTVSACRMKPDGGPARLRSRQGAGRFGVPGLTAGQMEKVDADSALWLKNLQWMLAVHRRNPEAKFFVEQPQDPMEWMRETADGDPPPSFLDWEETKLVSRMLGLREVRFDQRALGHATRKPTTTLTNMDKISALNGLGATAKGAPWPEELEARLEWAKQLAAWARAGRAVDEGGGP